MKPVSWKKALQNPLFAKGEIEIQGLDRDKIQRGPIKEIIVKNDTIFFRLLWSAYYDIGTEKWTVADYEMAIVLKKSVTTVIVAPDGHLVLQSPDITVGNIFPEGGSRLDPEEVEGLDLKNLPKPEFVEANNND